MRTLSEIKTAVLSSQQCVDFDFGAGVSFDSEYHVVPNSCLIEDIELARELNAELAELNKPKMYALSINEYMRYECDRTSLIAVSTDVDKLKALASENTKVFDEQWTTGEFMHLQFDIELYKDGDIYSCTTYIIEPISVL